MQVVGLWSLAVVLLLGPEGGASIEAVEQRRIELIERISPAAVCIFDTNQRGGGSGVLIDPEGYGVTNYHVLADSLETRRGLGGLPDGKLYELEVLGVDNTGDVAMFRLIGNPPFPFVRLGDSDAVRLGDPVLAVGNPFTLSEDYAPTVTAGMVTGLHRYQSGQGKSLVYSDCIQVDASINPGNSGGPLFNLAGEVIGINGRISVSRRGRLNVGFGYAIAANQIKRFIPALRAELHARHGTLQATVGADLDGVLAFHRIGPESSAARAGIQSGDRLIRFDGTALTSANHYVSLLGAYPGDWPIPLILERDGQRRDVTVRLDTEVPKSQRPFAPNREVNLREIERVIEGFQRATLQAEDGKRPTSWKWKITRHETVSGVERIEQYQASQTGDGPLRLQRVYDDGAAGPRLIATDVRVREILPGDDQELQAQPDVEMTWAALYLMHRWLLDPVDTVDLTVVHHVGGDRLLGSDRTEDRLLEVLDWHILEQGWAKLAFDAESGLLRGIRVRDVPTGQEVRIQLLDHCDVGGAVWPTTIEVSAGNRRYRDVLADWELNP